MAVFPVFLFTLALANGQVDEANLPFFINSLAPYKHVYPPTNVSQSSCVPGQEQNLKCPLYLQLIMSFGGSFTSSGVVPAVQVALDQINARSDMLPGYTLHYTLLDSQCEHTMALDALHDGILHPPTKIAVVGAGCSVATEPTAEISHYYNLVQLSCISASTELMNRRRFRRHFQAFPADLSLAYGFFGVIRKSKWRKVSIVVEDEFLFTKTMNELKRLLILTNINFTETIYKPDVDPFIKDPDARIYILSMYAPYARQILCKAFNLRRNFKYPHYLFLVNGWYPNNWWEGNDEKEEALLKEMYGCNKEQRKSLVPYTLSVINAGLQSENLSNLAENGVSGYEIQQLYESYVNSSTLNVSQIFVYQLCYDAIWILANALNKTLTDIQTNVSFAESLRQYRTTNNSAFGLHDFNYNNSLLTDSLYNHLSATNYRGIVGNIAFSENGSRLVDTVDIRQFRYTGDDEIRPILIAKVHWQNITNFRVAYLEDETQIWPDGIPYDGEVTEQLVTVHLAVTVIFSLLGVCGTALAIFCTAWNIYYRNRKIIRLTSPYLNAMIGTGAVILYLNMFVHIIPAPDLTTERWLCNVEPWLFSIGYSLCFGTILAKMYRVHYIFSNPTAEKRPLNDWKLALFVLLLVGLDASILSVLHVVEFDRDLHNPSLVPSRENLEDVSGEYGEIFRNYIPVCSSRARYIIIGVLYGYKVLLQVVALILAIFIRKVYVKVLNDAKYIIGAIYVTSIITSIIIVSTYSLNAFVNLYAVVFCLGLFIGTTVIIILVFFPPMTGLLKDPDGSNAFERNDVTTAHFSSPTIKEIEELKDLRMKVQHLETQLDSK